MLLEWKNKEINKADHSVNDPITSHRTRAVFGLTNFRICPRLLLGISKPSIPGTCNGMRVSTIWDIESTKELSLISNKEETPTDLSRKLYLVTWRMQKYIRGLKIPLQILFQAQRRTLIGQNPLIYNSLKAGLKHNISYIEQKWTLTQEFGGWHT